MKLKTLNFIGKALQVLALVGAGLIWCGYRQFGLLAIIVVLAIGIIVFFMGLFNDED